MPENFVETYIDVITENLIDIMLIVAPATSVGEVITYGGETVTFGGEELTYGG